MKRLLIDLETLPEEGKSLTGELPEDVFDLPNGDAKPAGPLEFDLHAQRFGSELLLTGAIAAPFEFSCVRTLHPFVQTIRVDPAAISMEIEESGRIDASDALREEIILQFPPHPRCDDADHPQKCEIDSRYLAVDKPPGDGVETPPRPEGDDRWSALDDLKKPDTDR